MKTIEHSGSDTILRFPKITTISTYCPKDVAKTIVTSRQKKQVIKISQLLGRHLPVGWVERLLVEQFRGGGANLVMTQQQTL